MFVKIIIIVVIDADAAAFFLHKLLVQHLSGSWFLTGRLAVNADMDKTEGGGWRR